MYLQKLKPLLDRYEVISFDMFDTLISRLVYKPTDIFQLVAKRANIEASLFVRNRIAAEKAAVEESGGYCTFDIESIYSKFKSEEAALFMGYEIEAEIDVTIANKKFLNIYKYCKQKNKKIIVTTDTYLPQDIVEKILEKNMIEYDKLFVSCNLKKTKSRGDIFEYILLDLGIKANEMIHIGDNYRSDYKKPIGYNIKSIWFNPVLQVKRKVFKEGKICAEDFLTRRYTELRDFNDKLEEFGYNSIGVMLAGYAKWVKSFYDQEGFENIICLSRDGFLIYKALKIFFPNMNNIRYAHISRRSIRQAFAFKCDENDIFDFLPRKIASWREICEYLGVCPEQQDIVALEKLHLNIDLRKEICLEDKLEIKKLWQLNSGNFQYQYRLLGEYLNQLEYFSKKTLFLDIGWKGTIYSTLHAIYKTEKDSAALYMGMEYAKEAPIKSGQYGYIYNSCDHPLRYCRYQNAISHSSILLEEIFSSDEGTAIYYGIQNKKVVAELAASKEHFDKFKDIQSGAIQFCKDINQHGGLKYLSSSLQIITQNYFDAINHPNMLEKEIGDYCIDNKYIGRPYHKRSLFYYILHIKVFISDLHVVSCKEIFLQSIFKINMPYCYIIRILQQLRGGA